MSLAELACAIRLVAEGGTYIPPVVLDWMMTDRSTPRESANKHVQFSRRQLQVIELLHQGKSNRTIAYELGMAETTVKVHVRIILKKLNARTTSPLYVGLGIKRIR